MVGKIHQDLDTFRMPVEISVDTEGNPETKKILVTGTTQPFEMDTFGRPKPNGITIDPNNNLLKSSPRLRVHALIARGEGFARSRQVLRGHSGVSEGSGHAAEQFARAFPHGRGDVLPEELSRRQQTRFARLWAGTWIPSGLKFGATFILARFTTFSDSASEP